MILKKELLERLRKVEQKTKNLTEEIEEVEWKRTNPPKFKYGDTFDDNGLIIKVLGIHFVCRRFFTLTSMYWEYDVDGGFGLIKMEEDVLMKCKKR